MTQQALQQGPENIRYVESRFGRIRINLDKKIVFPSGILGLGSFHEYCLSEFPNDKFKDFMILQSIEDEALSFVVLPVSNAVSKYKVSIPEQLLQETASEIAINYKDLVFFLIVSIIRKEDGKADISVNQRAPIVVNAVSNQAMQYVYHDENLLISYPISL